MASLSRICLQHFYPQFYPWLLPYELGSTQVQAVDTKLKDRDFISKLLIENLKET